MAQPPTTTLLDVISALQASGRALDLTPLAWLNRETWRLEGLLPASVVHRALGRCAHEGGPSWLLRAVAAGNGVRAWELLAWLRRLGPAAAPALAKDAHEATVLACSTAGPRDEALARALLLSGAQLDCRALPLREAAAWSPALVGLLLQRGARVNARDAATGAVALHAAAAADQADAVGVLLTAPGVDVNADAPRHGVATPLLTAAAAHARLAVGRLLTRAGRELDCAAADAGGWTPLHHAAGWHGPRAGRPPPHYTRAHVLDVARALTRRLRRDLPPPAALAALTRRSREFTTPLDLAARLRNEPLVALLRDAVADAERDVAAGAGVAGAGAGAGAAGGAEEDGAGGAAAAGPASAAAAEGAARAAAAPAAASGPA